LLGAEAPAGCKLFTEDCPLAAPINVATMTTVPAHLTGAFHVVNVRYANLPLIINHLYSSGVQLITQPSTPWIASLLIRSLFLLRAKFHPGM